MEAAQGYCREAELKYKIMLLPVVMSWRLCLSRPPFNVKTIRETCFVRGYMKKLALCFCLFLPMYGVAANCDIVDSKLCDKATQGDPEAQAKVGETYYFGGDKEIGMEWLEKSAKQNNPRAQYLVGATLMGMSVTGQIGNDEFQRGIALVEKSADQNHVAAMLYLKGYYGARGDDLQAQKWSNRACNSGHEKSCQNQ